MYTQSCEYLDLMLSIMYVSVDEHLEYEHALTPFSRLVLPKTA